MNVGISLTISVILLAINGFFVAAEFALLASRKTKLEALAAEGSKAARAAIGGLDHLTMLLAGTQLGITMCSLGIGIFAEPALSHLIEAPLERFELPSTVVHTIGFVLALTIASYLHMVVGEMAAKSIALAHPEQTTLVVARPFLFTVKVFAPLVSFLNHAANAVIRLFGVTPTSAHSETVGPADLAILVRTSTEQGLLNPFESRLLARTVHMQSLVAHQVMTPRRNFVYVSPDATCEEIERVSLESGRSRLVVLDDNEQAHGIVHVKDALIMDDNERAQTNAGQMAREILTVAPMLPVARLMEELRGRSIQMAVVINEFGAVEGLVTLEDTLEELVGEFYDEEDTKTHQQLHKTETPGDWRIDELYARTGIALPQGKYDTIAGFILEQLGHIPKINQSIDITHFVDPAIVIPGKTPRIVVTGIEDHRISTVAFRGIKLLTRNLNYAGETLPNVGRNHD